MHGTKKFSSTNIRKRTASLPWAAISIADAILEARPAWSCAVAPPSKQHPCCSLQEVGAQSCAVVELLWPSAMKQWFTEEMLKMQQHSMFFIQSTGVMSDA